jgi:hypothetical protein
MFFPYIQTYDTLGHSATCCSEMQHVENCAKQKMLNMQVVMLDFPTSASIHTFNIMQTNDSAHFAKTPCATKSFKRESQCCYRSPNTCLVAAVSTMLFWVNRCSGAIRGSAMTRNPSQAVLRRPMTQH